MSKDLNDQLKLFHKVADVMNRPNRKICMTLLRYYVDKPTSSCATLKIFAREDEKEKFEQIV